MKLVKTQVLINGAAISLYRFDDDSGHHLIEVIGRSVMNGKPWYPTLDFAGTLKEDTDATFDEMVAEWRAKSRESVDAEIESCRL